MEAKRSPARTDALPEERTRAAQHFIFFLPYLRLETRQGVAGVDFLPFRDSDGRVTPPLEGAEDALSRILTSYIDRHGSPYDNCVVATIPGRGWDLNVTDGPTIFWSASLLFLASWAGNQYFPRFAGDYTNSSSFRVVAQAFTGNKPVYMTVGARRRDGNAWDGGYKHGELHFSTPAQCPLRDACPVDTPFLAALNDALAGGSTTIERLRTALPFVQLANTDDDVMTADAEAILMASAFEQLLDGGGKKYRLGKSFGEQFQDFGNVTVACALQTRPDIEIDPKYADAQREWWVHRKWIEELYSLRNKVAHVGSHGTRRWGSRPDEHLVMAAFVFPLAVKLLLSREGHYSVTSVDQAHCGAIDKLLAATAWDTEPEGDGTGSAWHSFIAEAVQGHELEKSIRAFLKEHPALFADGDGGTTTL